MVACLRSCLRRVYAVASARYTQSTTSGGGPGGGVAELGGGLWGVVTVPPGGIPRNLSGDPKLGVSAPDRRGVTRGGVSWRCSLWGVGVVSPGGAPQDLSGHPKHGVSTPDRSGVRSGWSGVSPDQAGGSVGGGDCAFRRSSLGRFRRPQTRLWGLFGRPLRCFPEGCCEEQPAGRCGAPRCATDSSNLCLSTPPFQTSRLDAFTSQISLHVALHVV
ncbi:hypothetical protein ACJJTC_016590 [Scirpophaga incertulas]